jgi:predicted Fe-S protein YdhL (DUF1289 family)
MSKQSENSRTLHVKPQVPSPCVRNCFLDQQDICMGCFRHLDEITGWSSYSNAQRELVLSQCHTRRNLVSG